MGDVRDIRSAKTKRSKSEKDLQSKYNAHRPHRTERRKKRSRRIFFGFLFFFTISTLIALSLTVYFFITDIEVTGNTKYTKEEIINNTNISLNENLFRADLRGSREKIIRNLPYVDDVKIRRKLPSTVIIEVKESIPVAQFNVAGSYYIVDANSRVLENIGGSPKAGLPVCNNENVKTVNVGQAVYQEGSIDRKDFLNLISGFEKYGFLNKVDYINFYSEFSIKFMYNNRIEVDIGNGQMIDEKLSSFAAIIQRIPESQKGKLDISNPDKAPFVATP